jgi:FkbM family methyltransferase
MAAVAKPIYSFCAGLSTQLARKVRKNGVSVRLPNGQNLRLARDAGVELASLLHWGGVDAYEPHTSRTLRFFFQRVNSFVDVGANYGFYSLIAGLSNPKLRVIAFEPVPEICSALMKNVVENGLQARIETHQVALSNCTGVGRFFLPASEAMDCESTGTLAAGSWQERRKSPSFPVTTVRFDDFERQHPITLELVKLDVEDFEADVLIGMEGTIARDRPFIICEILPRAHGNERTREWVESAGYTPYWITPCGYIRVSRFDFARPAWQDFLLSPVSVPGEILSDMEGLWAEAALSRQSAVATR